jgi:hypothetical protein
MKTTLLLVASLALGACSFAARSPEMYRDDTAKALATKNGEIQACYDGVLKGNPGAAGKVTVKFDVETESGKISHVTVDKAQTTAPDPVADCVMRSIDGLTLNPPDARKGEGTWRTISRLPLRPRRPPLRPKRPDVGPPRLGAPLFLIRGIHRAARRRGVSPIFLIAGGRLGAVAGS